MKRLGILLLCLTIGGSSVLTAMESEGGGQGATFSELLATANGDRKALLDGFVAQVKETSLEELHELENEAIEGNGENPEVWSTYNKLSCEYLKEVFDKCHRGSPGNKNVAESLKKVVSELHGFSVDLKCDYSGKSYDSPKKVFPFRPVIDQMVWEIVNKKLVRECTRLDSSTMRYFPRIEEFNHCWKAVETMIDTEKKYGSLKKRTVFFVEICIKIAEQGGFSSPAKPVDLAAQGLSFVGGDIHTGGKVLSGGDNDYRKHYQAGIEDQQQVVDGDQPKVDKKKTGVMKKVLVVTAAIGAGAALIFFGKEVYNTYQRMQKMGDKGEEVLDRANKVLDKPHKVLARAIKEVGSDSWDGAVGLVVNGWKWFGRLFCRSKGDDGTELNDVKGCTNLSTEEKDKMLEQIANEKEEKGDNSEKEVGKVEEKEDDSPEVNDQEQNFDVKKEKGWRLPGFVKKLMGYNQEDDGEYVELETMTITKRNTESKQKSDDENDVDKEEDNNNVKGDDDTAESTKTNEDSDGKDDVGDAAVKTLENQNNFQKAFDEFLTNVPKPHVLRDDNKKDLLKKKYIPDIPESLEDDNSEGTGWTSWFVKKAKGGCKIVYKGAKNGCEFMYKKVVSPKK